MGRATRWVVTFYALIPELLTVAVRATGCLLGIGFKKILFPVRSSISNSHNEAVLLGILLMYREIAHLH